MSYHSGASPQLRFHQRLQGSVPGSKQIQRNHVRVSQVSLASVAAHQAHSLQQWRPTQSRTHMLFSQRVHHRVELVANSTSSVVVLDCVQENPPVA